MLGVFIVRLGAALSFSLHTLTCAKHTQSFYPISHENSVNHFISDLWIHILSLHFQTFIKTFLKKCCPHVEKCDTKTKGLYAKSNYCLFYLKLFLERVYFNSLLSHVLLCLLFHTRLNKVWRDLIEMQTVLRKVRSVFRWEAYWEICWCTYFTQ